MNWKASDDFLDMLMSGKGEQYLDREIEKLRLEIGESQFQQFADQYFKREGQQNQYAPKLDVPKNQQIEKQNKNPQHKQSQIVFPTQPVQTPNDEKYFKNQIKEDKEEDEIIQQQNQQGTTNNQQEGLTEISRQKLQGGNIKIVYNNGDCYEGQVEGQKKEGWGTYYYNNGERCSGCFVEDQIHGYGRYYFLGGAEYEGDWSSGMKHGIGILKFANGDAYEGKFCKDEFHGDGIYRYKNGDIFEGKYKVGKRQGRGKFEGADGHLQIGEWNDDKFQV